MIKKITVTLITLVLLATVAPVSLADSGGQKHYNGLVGSDSPLYGLKVGFQNLDLALTFNNTEKLKKQMNLADERIAEAQDAAEGNNTGAYNAAIDGYDNLLATIDETAQDESIDQGIYADLAPMLYHHQEVLYTIIGDPNINPDVTFDIQNRTMAVNEEIIKMKNGMPFYYYNGEQYFIPPGQAKKLEAGVIGNTITNGSKVPPGLAKKSYKNPTPTITNGSMVWPWDQIDYTSSTKGNGKGNGNGNNKNK
jgi:hypothetical protein